MEHADEVCLFYSPAALTLTKSAELEPECPENKDKEPSVELPLGSALLIKNTAAADGAHGLDLRAVGELLDGVAVLGVVLQQDGHLEGGGLQRVPGNDSRVSGDERPSDSAWVEPLL